MSVGCITVETDWLETYIPAYCMYIRMHLKYGVMYSLLLLFCIRTYFRRVSVSVRRLCVCVCVCVCAVCSQSIRSYICIRHPCTTVIYSVALLTL